jgi:putative chitobiose transport system substrate-binding protein
MWQLVLTLCLCLSFSGCTTHSEKPKAIHLQLMTLEMLGFKPWMTSTLHRFETTHPGVLVDWVDVPFSEGEKRALTSVLSGHPPDVMNLNPDFAAILASRQALSYFDERETQHFAPVTVQAAQLDHKQFALPWYVNTAITLYNAELFKQAGLKEPPCTFEELFATLKPFHDKTGRFLIMPVLAEGGRFFRWLSQAGIPLWEESGRLRFADSGAEKLLSAWVNAYQQGWIPAESLTESQQAGIDRFQSGQVAMVFAGANFAKNIQENSPQIAKKTRVAAQFPACTGSLDFSQMILVVPSDSPQPLLAKALVRHLTQAEQTLGLAQQTMVLPPDLSALRHPFFADHPESLLGHARYLSAQQLLHAKPIQVVHRNKAVLNSLMDYYVQLALLGKLSPDKAMKEAQRKMNEAIGL